MARRITNAEIRSEQDLINLGADRTNLPHSSKIYIDKTGIEKRLDEYLVKNYFEADRDPNIYDDSTQYYEVGSRWVNTLSEKIFTCVNADASGAIWSQGGGGIETFITVSEAEDREDSEDYDLIYVVETESIYRYSASGLAGIPDDGYYILKDNTAYQGRWKGIAGRYILDREDSGNFYLSHTITSAETSIWHTAQSLIPYIEAYFWDDSEGQYNLLSAASLNIDISATGAVSYDSTSFVFDSNDKIVLYASYSTIAIQNANEYDSDWILVSSINNLPSSGYHRIDLPNGFTDNPAGYSLTLDDGINIFPSDIASRLIFSNNGSGTYRVTIDTEGLDPTDKFRLVCSKSARPTGAQNRGITHDAVVGTPEHVLAGYATHSSLQTAISFITNGGRILLLTSVVENITWINSDISIEGKGRSTSITGTLNINGDGNHLKLVRCVGNVTINGDINFVSESWIAPTYTLVNNGTDNLVSIIQE